MGYEVVDPLTRLPTRVAFPEFLREALTAPDGAPASLAIVDVDKFLSVNERYGRPGGDAALAAIAARLEAMPCARAFRYGGDEFVVIMAGVEREQAFLRLEACRAEIAALRTLTIGGVSVEASITVSAGIAAFPIDGSNEAELLRKADGALYRAKLGGRNRVMLAFEERMTPKTSHYTVTQLERLSDLAREQGIGEAVLLREALDDLLVKYVHGFRKD